MSRIATWARAIVLRALLLGLGWVAVTEADASVAVYGLVAVPLATATSLVLTRGPGASAPRPRQVLAAVSLVGWVLWRSVVGGVDVARRTLHLPRADVDPYWTSHELALEGGTARATLALVLNLMPGTLSADLDGDRMAVHVIAPGMGVEASIAELERRIARVAGADRG